jgi:alkyldihydroxyacetonephosphate synthase
MTRPAIDTEALARALRPIVGDERISARETDLTTYSRDMWPRLLLSIREGTPLAHRAHLVVWPESVREVAAIIDVARSMRVPIIPYGGGSGVCGGTVPVHGGIALDLKRMDAMAGVDREDMICNVEAGVNGERFERELATRGYTFGHFPSSIYVSTVGGWVATRAAGQMSSKYGKVEDRVAGVTMVTGRGEVIETDGLARSHRGPNWTQLLVGSEGTLGVITSARLRVNAAPELRVLRGYSFPDVIAGIEAIRRIMQRGLRPAVLRLYDEFDTFMNALPIGGSQRAPADVRHRQAPTPPAGSGALPHVPMQSADVEERSGVLGQLVGQLVPKERRRGLTQSLRREIVAATLSRPRIVNSIAGPLVERVSRRGCRLIVGLEGPRVRTEVEARLTTGELERAGGVDLGEEPGRDWLEHRYAVSYKMSPVFRAGAFVDTMEVASTWERLVDLYRSVRGAIAKHALVMAHFSHAYPEGCSIYFTFAAYAESQQRAERIYDAIWRDGLEAATRAGGTISHHHGVGLLKAPYMRAEHREAMAIFEALKQSMDPDGIMNPGKLGLARGGVS